MTAVADRVPNRAEVLEELQKVRRRGYTQLDANRTRPTTIATPSLEYAVTKIPGYRSNMTRKAALELLLKHEIAALGEPFAELLTLSFGTRPGLDSTDPIGLRRRAARLAKQSIKTFSNDKEAVALGALADQIVADCFALDGESGQNIPTVVPDDASFLTLSPRRDAMDEDQATQVIREAFEDPDEVDVYRLALSLNFDPPLVYATCEYLKEENISIAKACDIIAIDSGVFLDSLARYKQQPVVTRQVRQKIEGLTSEHPRAVRALDFISFLHHEHIAAEYVMAYLLECRYIDLDKFQHADLVYEEAMQPLIDAELVEHNGAFARMNPLTHSIVRELRRGRCSEINDQLHAIGFMSPSDAPSAWQLMEAKWSPTSIASRWVLEFVLSTRLHDQLWNNRRSERAGKLAGANWLLIVAALRERFVYRATSCWVRYELAKHLDKAIVELSRDGGTLSDYINSESKRLSNFRDRIDFVEINPMLDDALANIVGVVEGMPRLPKEDIVSVSSMYFKSKSDEIYLSEETRFWRDEVATLLGISTFPITSPSGNSRSRQCREYCKTVHHRWRMVSRRRLNLGRIRQHSRDRAKRLIRRAAREPFDLRWSYKRCCSPVCLVRRSRSRHFNQSQGTCGSACTHTSLSPSTSLINTSRTVNSR